MIDLYYKLNGANPAIEELATPIPPSVLSKGKDTADLPLLHYQLSWDGRYKYLEDAGLPLNPPGKMFRYVLHSKRSC